MCGRGEANVWQGRGRQSERAEMGRACEGALECAASLKENEGGPFYIAYGQLKGP